MKRAIVATRVRRLIRVGAIGAIGAALALGTAGCGRGGDEGDEPTKAARPATTAPAPSGGNITETVAPVDVETLAPVTLTKPVDVDDVTIKLAKVEKVTVKAVTPGEVAGPAVALTISVDNKGTKAVDLSGVAVMMIQGDGSSGTATTSSPAAPFTGSVQPGKSASGVYVFAVNEKIVNPITVTVSYVAGSPTATFTGDVAQ